MGTNQDASARRAQPRVGQVIGDRYELRHKNESWAECHGYVAHDRAEDREVSVRWHGRVSELAGMRCVREAGVMRRATAEITGVIRYLAELVDQGAAYLVAEPMSGVWLDTWQQTAHPRGELLATYARMAETVQAIHDVDMVCRDLRPRFVLIATGGAPLIDVGLALYSKGADTPGDALVGTPCYISPEALLGEPMLTGAIDVFALGCMLLEGLTGAPPWHGTVKQMMLARLDAPPNLYDLAGTELGALISAMLAREPTARPSAAEVARVLDAHARAS